MKVQLLPSSFDSDRGISQHQRLTSFVIDDKVAVDAGSLAFSCSDVQREAVRDIIVSHTHLDHIAGLPIFLDDLFGSLTEPVRIHLTREMADILERDVFNGAIYPRFSELRNEHGKVIEYVRFIAGDTFTAAHLSVTAVEVNHNSPSFGFLVSDGTTEIGITGDTAETTQIWEMLAASAKLSAIFVECAFPNEMARLASDSHHLTPARLADELKKIEHLECRIFVSNIKAMYRDQVVDQLRSAAIPNVVILEIGRIYEL